MEDNNRRATRERPIPDTDADRRPAEEPTPVPTPQPTPPTAPAPQPTTEEATAPAESAEATQTDNRHEFVQRSGGGADNRVAPTEPTDEGLGGANV